jgi:hypothetical protein
MKATISPVAASRQAEVLGLDDAHPALPADRDRTVVGAVADQDGLEIRVLQPPQGLQALADGARAVVAADHHRNARPCPGAGEGNLGEGFAHRLQRGLGAPQAVGEPEVPLGDVVPAAMPFVRPAEDERPGTSGRERGANLPAQRVRLGEQAVPLRVEAHLAQQQRPVAGQVLEPRQIRVETLARLEVDVEAHEVQEWQVEVFGRGIVDVSDEAARILSLGGVVEALEKAFHGAPAMPANHRGGDLAADGIAQNGGMSCAGGHTRAHAVLDCAGQPDVVEEGDVLLPGDANHHPQAVPVRRMQQPPRWHGVRADGVETLTGDARQVAVHGVVVVELAGVGVGPEGAVGDSTDPERLSRDRDPLAADLRPLGPERALVRHAPVAGGCQYFRLLLHLQIKISGIDRQRCGLPCAPAIPSTSRRIAKAAAIVESTIWNPPPL